MCGAICQADTKLLATVTFLSLSLLRQIQFSVNKRCCSVTFTQVAPHILKFPFHMVNILRLIFNKFNYNFYLNAKFHLPLIPSLSLHNNSNNSPFSIIFTHMFTKLYPHTSPDNITQTTSNKRTQRNERRNDYQQRVGN